MSATKKRRAPGKRRAGLRESEGGAGLAEVSLHPRGRRVERSPDPDATRRGLRIPLELEFRVHLGRGRS